MTVREFLNLFVDMPPDKLIVFSEPLEDTGEYETINVYERDDEVVIDIS